jgi:hypothetical protein
MQPHFPFTTHLHLTARGISATCSFFNQPNKEQVHPSFTGKGYSLPPTRSGCHSPARVLAANAVRARLCGIAPMQSRVLASPPAPVALRPLQTRVLGRHSSRPRARKSHSSRVSRAFWPLLPARSRPGHQFITRAGHNATPRARRGHSSRVQGQSRAASPRLQHRGHSSRSPGWSAIHRAPTKRYTAKAVGFLARPIAYPNYRSIPLSLAKRQKHYTGRAATPVKAGA